MKLLTPSVIPIHEINTIKNIQLYCHYEESALGTQRIHHTPKLDEVICLK